MTRKPTHADLARLSDAARWRELWTHALPIARQVTDALIRSGRVPPHMEADVRQAAYLAAGLAVRTWRPLDATLSACLTSHIRGSVRGVLSKEPATASLNEETEGESRLDALAYDDPPAGFGDPLEEAAHLQAEERVHGALAGLRSHKDRHILTAVYGIGAKPMTLDTYAEKERISRREARYRLSEAKRRLAARLGGMTP
jgi:DNA-directed RNA polymerase sigma subunit (sigma70/sigma32)